MFVFVLLVIVIVNETSDASGIVHEVYSIKLILAMLLNTLQILYFVFVCVCAIENLFLFVFVNCKL